MFGSITVCRFYLSDPPSFPRLSRKSGRVFILWSGFSMMHALFFSLSRMRSHGSWRKVQETIRFYSSSSSASGLLEFLNTDFPSTIGIRGRREFARLLQLRASDDLVSLLRASASLTSMGLSKQIHGLMFKYGVNLDIFAGSALIDVNSNCYCLKDSKLVFDEMKDKDLVVWNSMFSGYVQQSENDEALNLFLELQLSRERPDEFTFADMVTAAGNLASLQLGQEFHCQLMKRGLERNPYITNALLDMYAKCGSPEDAHKAFDSVASRDVVCWNSVISSNANHGEGRKALQMLQRMMDEGIEPNYITFVGILSAYSHAGLVEDGLKQFELMLRLGIEPETEHYGCMVSLLGRAGRLTEARELIEKMPTKPAATIWRSLLSGCAMTGNIELAEYAAEMAILSDPTDSGSFTLLSNIYASKGMWTDVKKVRERMKCVGVVKEPGRSWILIDNEVHIFLSKDKSHRKANQIYEVLDNLLLQIKGVNYHTRTHFLLSD